MNHLQRVTQSWAEWVAGAEPGVLDTITHVQLKNRPGGGGWDVHIHAWNADQLVVDTLASAVGCPTDDGWKPPSGNSDWQWALSTVRDDLDWHITATTPAKPTGADA